MLGTKTLFMAFCALSGAKGMDINMEINITDKAKIRKITKWIIGVVMVSGHHFSNLIGDCHGFGSECSHASD